MTREKKTGKDGRRKEDRRRLAPGRLGLFNENCGNHDYVERRAGPRLYRRRLVTHQAKAKKDNEKKKTKQQEDERNIAWRHAQFGEHELSRASVCTFVSPGVQYAHRVQTARPSPWMTSGWHHNAQHEIVTWTFLGEGTESEKDKETDRKRILCLAVREECARARVCVYLCVMCFQIR